MVHRSESELICDDILFEKRNKLYGAYDLRNIYNNHLKIAVFISVLLFSVILLFPKIASFFKSEEIKNEEFKITEVILAEPPPIDPKTTPPPPNVEAPPPKIASTKFLPPKILDDEKVIEEDEPPTQEELKKTNPGEVTQKGENENLNEVIVSGNGKSEIGENNDILLNVQEPSVYQGDYIKFLNKNLNYPEEAEENETQGKVVLDFVIEKDGSITDLKVVKKLGHGCDEEAIRVVKLTNKKWSIAKNNGVPVRYRKTLGITFRIN